MEIFLQHSRWFFLNIFCYYVLPVFIIGILLFSSDRYEISVEMGEQAWVLLLVILFLKPISQILPGLKTFSRLLVFRKQLGVAMLWLVIGHGVGTALDKGLFHIDKFMKIMTQVDHYLFWGVLAGGIILLLGMTSNIFSMKLLKRNWKRLHMLAYLALVFTALHIYFIIGEVSSLLLVIIYGILKIMAWKKIILYPKK